MAQKFTPKTIKRIQSILRRHTRSQFDAAIKDIRREVDSGASIDSLANLFRRNGMATPFSFLQKDAVKAQEPGAPRIASFDAGTVERLVKLTRKGSIQFSQLCDKLDLSPKRTKALIDAALEQGINLHVEHNAIGIKPDIENTSIQDVGVPPVVGKRQRIAVISDTHLGSKYCLRAQLQEFIHYAYGKGVRDILHPGDMLDGMYEHGKFELTHVGIDAQTQDLFETLPQLPGLRYHAITGNHDFTFTEKVGIEVGPFITRYFAERGRHDFKCYGNRSAYLKIKGAVVHLWHPRSGGAYALSYGIQKKIEAYSPGNKPGVLLTGHWHRACYVSERGIHAFACPTFQGAGSGYSKSLVGSPSIGGLLLSWDLTEHGTLRSFVVEKRSYFEVEKPHVIEEPESIPVLSPKKSGRRTAA